MNWSFLAVILAQGNPSGPTQPPPAWVNIVPLVLIMVVFYFLLIRPQQKKAKEHAQLLGTLRPNDRVVTSSGLVGVIISVKEKTVTLRCADTKLEILKGSVSEITERGAGNAES